MNIQAEKLANAYGLKISSMEELTGGITNFTYLISDATNKYVARIAGEGTNKFIDRENEIYNMKLAYSIKLSPKVLLSQDGNILMEFISNHMQYGKEDIRNMVKLKKISTALLVLHNSQLNFLTEYNVLFYITKYKEQLNFLNAQIPLKLNKHAPYLMNIIEKLFTKYEKKLVPCHVDPKLSNFLVSDNKVFLIDWEYSGMADVYFELANFVLTNELEGDLEDLFLKEYFVQCKETFIYEKYLLYKIATDYLWIYWHLIKLNQKSNKEFNDKRWKERLYRALYNCKKWEEIS